MCHTHVARRLSIVLAVSASSKLGHLLVKKISLIQPHSQPHWDQLRAIVILQSHAHTPSKRGMSMRLVRQQWQFFQYDYDGWLRQIYTASTVTWNLRALLLDLYQSICSCTEWVIHKDTPPIDDNIICPWGSYGFFLSQGRFYALRTFVCPRVYVG